MHEGHSHKSGTSIIKWIAIGCVVFLLIILIAFGGCYFLASNMMDTNIVADREKIVNGISDELVKAEVVKKFDAVQKLEMSMLTKTLLFGNLQSTLINSTITDEEIAHLHIVLDAIIAGNGTIPVNDMEKYGPIK